MSHDLVAPARMLEGVNRAFWGTPKKQRDLLLRKAALPRSWPLGGISGNVMIGRLNDHRDFLDAWRDFPHQPLVQWRTVNRNGVGVIEVPERFEVAVLDDVLLCLTPESYQTFSHRSEVLDTLAGELERVYERQFDPMPLLEMLSIDLTLLDEATPQWISDVIALMPQLTQGCGSGCYLRALPVTGTHTKFLEANVPFLERALDFVYDGKVLESGGLIPWLDVREPPRGWLVVRGLDEGVRQKISPLDLDSLRMHQNSLANLQIDVEHILIIENEQTAYALPELPSTLVIAGAGNNLSWMASNRLFEGKRVAYWGDIDVEGLKFLSDARMHLPSITPLMMSKVEFDRFADHQTAGANSIKSRPEHLSESEIRLFDYLLSSKCSRLEQEYIDQNYVQRVLSDWIAAP